MLELLEEAVEDGHADELHELLCFEPQTGEEHFARYYYEAEYHILSNRPIQALEILARLDTPDLGSVQKLWVWYKIAVAQRMTHNFAGAGETLERLVEKFPGRETSRVSNAETRAIHRDAGARGNHTGKTSLTDAAHIARCSAGRSPASDCGHKPAYSNRIPSNFSDDRRSFASTRAEPS